MRVSGKQAETMRSNRIGGNGREREGECAMHQEFAAEWMGDGGRIERQLRRSGQRP